MSKKESMSKTNIQFTGTLNAGYNLKYNYNTGNHQQITSIADTSYRCEGPISKDSKLQSYLYDANGNLLCVNNTVTNKSGSKGINDQRRMLWDEENRLLSVSDNGFVSNYWYDASGERTVKIWGETEAVSVNGKISGGHTSVSKFSVYANPYLVFNSNGECSDHIYIGSQRVASVLFTMASFVSSPSAIPVKMDGTNEYALKYQGLTNRIKTRFDSLGVVYRGSILTSNLSRGLPSTSNYAPYYYHSDHLGSSSLVTNLAGNVVQHLEYIPFGEVFLEENNGTLPISNNIKSYIDLMKSGGNVSKSFRNDVNNDLKDYANKLVKGGYQKYAGQLKSFKPDQCLKYIEAILKNKN